MKRSRGRSSSVAAIALAMILGFVLYERNRSDQAIKEYQKQAQFVSLPDGSRLRIRHSGKENLGYPIILESGIGGTSADWAWLQAELAQEYQVIAYDRPGLGLSDVSALTRDGLSLAKNLDVALRQLQVKPPYILVGHSYGGLLVRLYRDLYPEKVAGILLVDPSHPEQDQRLPGYDVKGTNALFQKIRRAAYFSNFGMPGLARLPSFGKGLPRLEQEEENEFYHNPKHLYAVTKEVDAIAQTYEQSRKLAPLGDLPLGIVSATEPKQPEVKAFQEMHEEYARLSGKSFHVFVEGASHATILWEKRYAPALTEHLRTLIELIAKKPGQAEVGR